MGFSTIFNCITTISIIITAITIAKAFILLIESSSLSALITK